MVSLKAKEIFCTVYSGLLFVSGLILIGCSAYFLFKLFYHYTFIPSSSIGPFFTIFVLGIVHLFLTWLGVKGPPREHNFHIILFMVFTIILLVSEFAVGIWSVILWDEVEIGSIDLMTKSFQNYDKKIKYWNKLQHQLQCCGMIGTGDYNNQTIPSSCYLDSQKINLATVGCRLPLIRYTKRILIDGVIIGFVCAAFQGLGFFAFYSFFKTLRVERTERAARRAAMQREMSVASGGIQTQVYIPVGSAPPPSGAASGGEPASVAAPSEGDKGPSTPPVSASP